LVKASKAINESLTALEPVDLTKIEYGHAETKRSIANIVNAVRHQYKFASLPEFNAILLQYNVVADRGSERSTMCYRFGYLPYH
jgi:hypothetical protein